VWQAKRKIKVRVGWKTLEKRGTFIRQALSRGAGEKRGGPSSLSKDRTGDKRKTNHVPPCSEDDRRKNFLEERKIDNIGKETL